MFSFCLSQAITNKFYKYQSELQITNQVITNLQNLDFCVSFAIINKINPIYRHKYLKLYLYNFFRHIFMHQQLILINCLIDQYLTT